MEEKRDKELIDTINIERAEKALKLEDWAENPELDKRLNRKFDLHILPWLFGIWYILSILVNYYH